LIHVAIDFSDIDIVLVSPTPESLLEDRNWLNSLGDPAVVGDEDWELVQSILIFFRMLEVEFGIAGLDWVRPPIDSGTAAVMRQPMRLLYDPESLIAIAIANVRLKNR